MALSQQDQDIATAVAGVVGTTLKLLPDQADIATYTALIKNEIDIAAAQVGTGNPVKDEVEALLALGVAIDNKLPDGTNGKKKLKAVLAFVTGIVHMFGL